MDKHVRNRLISDGAFAAIFGAFAVMYAVHGLDAARNGEASTAILFGALAIAMVYAAYRQGGDISDTLAEARKVTEVEYEECSWCDATGEDPFGIDTYSQEGIYGSDLCPVCKGTGKVEA